jgi:Zn-dependent protease
LILIAGFGWAKPVQVNTSYFRRPRLMDFFVTFAGPLSNFLQAFVGVILIVLYYKFGLDSHISVGADKAVYMFLTHLISINVILFIFNLIPIAPLDGFHMLADVLPNRLRAALWNRQNIGQFILFAIVFIPPLRAVTIDPLFSLSDQIITGMINIVSIFF